ncbi:helix-turn-helix domain-containing protein [Thermomonospora cellulosilytica]|uniref:Excisionase family DNA binding protein n=1 Tax=Thermomonospora cellulosilytica TaxID=1411118 RepID=A0A7W3N1W0_9ACTN|nr:helix-turn-helix domain-containing protein [Thermomonospora cellulosilytica]MBA9005947.1 excisionase family DNA binding protein [Thermomonospora cellulosilytica]
MASPPPPEFWTVAEVAAQLRVHPVTVRRLAAAGQFAGAVKVGRQWRIPAGSVPATNATGVADG